ncbi:MAG: tripartite tricarboxylate transporter TctB family protein [Thermodesulfobacteriota bacterium]
MKGFRNHKDLLTGFLFMFFGIGAMGLSVSYRIGTAAKMGPGYFPLVLGGMLGALGLLILIRSLSTGEEETRKLSFRVRPALMILCSVVLFGLFIERLGLLPCTVLLVIGSSMASDEFRMREAILSAGVLIIVVLLVFVFLLKFQIPLWPSFTVARAWPA